MVIPMKRVLIIVGVLIIVAFAVWFLKFRKTENPLTSYTFVEITRGNLENTITSSGTLNPLKVVNVGTQVSGIIDHLLVDFNDTVKRGQVLAVLDTTLLAAAVHDAEAGILKSKAAYDAAINQYERNLKMYEKNYISEFDLITMRTNMESSKAQLESSQISLDRAMTNLGYAVIRSPISGKIIFKSVEEGQTVASSFSTPTIFIIAEDLSKMEIDALVDESDIGKITDGQDATFTVEAYLDKTFTGKVRQIRLQPTTVQNVVNYTVVIDAQNKDNLLLPGMTAMVDFIAESKKDVLLVPNLALRFVPTEDMQKEYQKNLQKNQAPLPDSLRTRQGGRRSGQPGSANGGQPSAQRNAPKDTAQLWYLDQNEKVNMTMIRIGATDGRMTEIVRGRNVKEGMKIISGVASQIGQRASTTGAPGMPFGRRMF
jgi:HlyD family secretion protein